MAQSTMARSSGITFNVKSFESPRRDLDMIFWLHDNARCNPVQPDTDWHQELGPTPTQLVCLLLSVICQGEGRREGAVERGKGKSHPATEDRASDVKRKSNFRKVAMSITL